MKTIIRITALIMACVFMAIGFAACSSTPAKDEAVERETKRYSITYYADEVPAFVADKIVKGSKVYDSENLVDLGLVTEVLNEDAICYASNEGKFVLTTKNGYRSIMISTTVEAAETVEGWYIGEALYGIGHTGTFHVGNTEVELTVRSFEALN